MVDDSVEAITVVVWILVVGVSERTETAGALIQMPLRIWLVFV